MVQASGGGSSYLIATILILMLMHMKISVAVQHVVGDDRGWDPLSDLPGWTSRNVFCVGDNLWFAYSTARGSILELKSAEEYERCDVSNPIRVYDGGLDAVPLAEAGTRYFISARPEHCQRGLKLRVQVISDGLHNHNSDNFDVVSDGLNNVGSSFDLISDGMEKGGDDDTDLVSDGLKETANNFNIFNFTSSWLPPSSSSSSSWFSYLSFPSSLWAIEVKGESATTSASEAMEAAEGPTSANIEYSSHSLRSSSLSLRLSSVCYLVVIILYYSIA